MEAGEGDARRQPHESFTVTVTAADGPRAQVPDPPFDDSTPLLAVTLETMPGGGGQACLPFLHLDLAGRPGAETVVRGLRRAETVLDKALSLFVHSSGNGYVGITVTERTPSAGAEPDEESGPGQRVLRVAVDPVLHAVGLAAAVRSGRLVMVHHWSSAEGVRRRALLPVDVDREMLERIVRAALTHPRSVQVGLFGGYERSGI
ncbi:hypothetical protein [Streptomyces sp. NPDC057238]|uniref:hypothetical protein n=1 Tax=Streptomyces sp. NPDC057238 TaxID=3346060 RepID=UPI003639D319